MYVSSSKLSQKLPTTNNNIITLKLAGRRLRLMVKTIDIGGKAVAGVVLRGAGHKNFIRFNYNNTRFASIRIRTHISLYLLIGTGGGNYHSDDDGKESEHGDQHDDAQYS